VPLKLAEIVDLIVDKSGKSKDEILQMIEEKKKELDGYVTDEGAASLVGSFTESESCSHIPS